MQLSSPAFGFAIVLMAVSSASESNVDADLAESPVLSARNLEAPFCYVSGETRCWPILEKPLPPDAQVHLRAAQEGKTLSEGAALHFSGLSVSLNEENMLEVVSEGGAPPLAFSLSITLRHAAGREESQTLQVRPAPPDRSLSYYADFGDDLIRIFFDQATGRFRPIEKSGFDQYFRRLQAQGIARLIVWLTPFPTVANPENYAEEDWNRYEQQARALVESEELDEALGKLNRYSDWTWIRQLCALRLMRDFGAMVSESATQHRIALTVSYRPFEAALTKYYEIPAFDPDGDFLWGFLPLATPPLNYHPEQLGFAHNRTILEEMGHADKGKLETIELPDALNIDAFLARYESHGDNLRILASDYPPLREDSFVLQRKAEGVFRVVRYDVIKGAASERLHEVTGFRLDKDAEGNLRVTNLDVPGHYRYLLLLNPSGAEEALQCRTIAPAFQRARAGNRLGRANVYWVLDDSQKGRRLTRVAGIPPEGNYHSEFRATEHSRELLKNAPEHLPLTNRIIVIDRGTEWGVERLDFNREQTRRNAVAELRTVLSYSAFDEVFINTRSHTALIRYINLGYAPNVAAQDPKLLAWAEDPQTIERITSGYSGEWNGFCRTPDSPHVWRYVRNRETANGVRSLLEDLEQAFPGTRIRAVIPPGETALTATQDALEELPKPDGGAYTRDYYRTIASTINYIPSVGEGMAMVDLSGLHVEPVFFGIRYLVDQSPLDLYVKNCIADLDGNRGSAFHGPRSFFYEAQETLRSDSDGAKRRRREDITRYLLSLKDDINEVIYYEAADWTYYLSLSDPDYCGHGFLDRPLAAMEATSTPLLVEQARIELGVANVGTTLVGRMDGKPALITQGYRYPELEDGVKRCAVEAVSVSGERLWLHEAPSEATACGQYLQWLEAPDLPEPLILWACFPPAEGGEGLDNRGGLLRAHDGVQIHQFAKGSNNASLIADLNNDGKMELLYCGQQFVSCLDLATRGPQWTHTDDVFFCWSYPTVTDLNDDGTLEVVWGSEYNLPDGKTSTVKAIDCQNRELWRVDGIDEDVGSTPVFVADVDGDGRAELVKNGLDLCAKNNLEANHLFVFSQEGKLLRKIPSLMYSTGIGDLNGDGTLEAFGVVCHRDGGRRAREMSHLRCVNLANGETVWEVPVPRVGLPCANALAADLNNDGKLEAIICDGNPVFYGHLPGPDWGAVYVVSHDGRLLLSVELPTWARRLVMCDLDDDGKNELVVQTDGKPASLYVFDTNAPATTATWHLPFGNPVHWGMEHRPPE